MNRVLHRMWALALLEALAGWSPQTRAADLAQYSPKLSAIDPSTDRVPPGYAGIECSSLVQALKRRFNPKAEFEAQADYEARAAQEADMQLGPRFKVSSPIAFALDSATFDSLYSVERQELQLKANPYAGTFARQGLVAFGAPPGAAVLAVKEQKLAHETYPATNAFGARVVASEARYRVCAVAAMNKNVRQLHALMETTLRMDSQRAEAVKPHLRAFVVGHLARPFLVKLWGRRAATFSEPEGFGKMERDSLSKYRLFGM